MCVCTYVIPCLQGYKCRGKHRSQLVHCYTGGFCLAVGVRRERYVRERERERGERERERKRERERELESERERESERKKDGGRA